jgi:hypothetical protein
MYYAPSRLLLLIATLLLAAPHAQATHSSSTAAVVSNSGSGGGGGSVSSSEGTAGNTSNEKPLLSIQLSTSVNDVIHDFGLIQNRVNPFAEDPALKAPPKTKWEDGAMNLGMFRALYTEGHYIVFVGNTTGNIPLGEVDEDVAAGDAPMCLRRWVTSDFSEWGGGECVQTFDASDMGAIKTMARNDQTGMLFAVLYESKNRLLYTSVDDGMSWTGPSQPQGLDYKSCTSSNCSGPQFNAKDDFNFVWTPSHGLIDFAIYYQKNYPMPLDEICDNAGWNFGGQHPFEVKPQRRVIGTIVATDVNGSNWTNCNSYLLPDPKADPPEMQFYRIRPSLIPGTESSRVWAHILQYAPSFDSVHLSNSKYGRQPSACSDKGPRLPDGRRQCCHGPHVGEYLATLRPHGDPRLVESSAGEWTRVDPFKRVYPRDAWGFAQPGLVANTDHATRTDFPSKMIVLGTGKVYSQLLHRASGIHAHANGRVIFPDPMTASPTARLYINADVRWHGDLVAGGCDEGCAAYLQVALVDPTTHRSIDGFSQGDCDVVLDRDAANILITWNGTALLPQGVPFKAMVAWRDGTVYAAYLGTHVAPRW